LRAHPKTRVDRKGRHLRQLRAARAVAALRPNHGHAGRTRHRRVRRSGSDSGEDHVVRRRDGRHNVKSLAGLAGVLILAIALSPTSAEGSRIFLQVGNLTDILRQISVIGIIALAMTFVILTAGIDLSVGSILALSTSVVAMSLTRTGSSLGYSQHILAAIL